MTSPSNNNPDSLNTLENLIESSATSSLLFIVGSSRSLHCNFARMNIEFDFPQFEFCTHFDDRRKHFWCQIQCSHNSQSHLLWPHILNSSLWFIFFFFVFLVLLFTSVECQTAHYSTKTQWVVCAARFFVVANTLTHSGRLTSHERDKWKKKYQQHNNITANERKRNRSHRLHTSTCVLVHIGRAHRILAAAEYKWTHQRKNLFGQSVRWMYIYIEIINECASARVCLCVCVCRVSHVVHFGIPFVCGKHCCNVVVIVDREWFIETPQVNWICATSSIVQVSTSLKSWDISREMRNA